MKLTDEELKKIREAVEAATKGRWIHNGNEFVLENRLRVGIGGFLTDEDNYLVEHAAGWLKAQQSHIDAITAEFKNALEFQYKVNSDLANKNALLLEQVKRMEAELNDMRRLQEQS